MRAASVDHLDQARGAVGSNSAGLGRLSSDRPALAPMVAGVERIFTSGSRNQTTWWS